MAWGVTRHFGFVLNLYGTTRCTRHVSVSSANTSRRDIRTLEAQDYWLKAQDYWLAAQDNQLYLDCRVLQLQLTIHKLHAILCRHSASLLDKETTLRGYGAPVYPLIQCRTTPRVDNSTVKAQAYNKINKTVSIYTLLYLKQIVC